MTSKYNQVMPLHMTIIAADMFFNLAATAAYDKNTAQLMIFILQDILLVMGVVILLITFSSTFVFRAGLMEVLAKEFWFTFLVSILYLVSCIALHVISLKDRWSVENYFWPGYLHAIYLTQRLLIPYITRIRNGYGSRYVSGSDLSPSTYSKILMYLMAMHKIDSLESLAFLGWVGKTERS
ncbi:unnamed protein product [Bursaphelenchus okinawaensis]|uniref:Transmembrane protein 138 n=1 Tax=Bursaphelenchus okinawaensis TaxID=465554 RepID=A0A811K8Y7_9BILA|nr:unnamed protein product [Bursaphelenchus okinawaensis]CAG9095341.1 unnamed protein product [Bursaphelenchus okinawaensis]